MRDTFFRWLICLGSAVLASLGPACSATPAHPAPMRPNRIRQVGNYRLVHWSNERANRERLFIQDRFGRLVASVPGVRVNVGAIRELTGDGYPEVVIQSWGGGAH